MKQPVNVSEVNSIRAVECTTTMQTLRDPKLISRAARPGPRREMLWRIPPHFLETFGLASHDELYRQGRKEEVFPRVFGGGDGEDEGEDGVGGAEL